MSPPTHGREAANMSTGVNAAVGAPAKTDRKHRLRRGRTRILAISDLAMLAVAYTVSYLIADRIAPLPPVSGAAWFLALVGLTAPFVWLAVFTANNLYDNDSLRISVSSFDEVRDLFHAMLVGSLGYLLLSQGVDSSSAGGSTHRPRRCIFLAVALVLGPGRARHDPELGLPAADAAAAHPDRRHRRRGAARLPQDHGAPGVRPRGRRLPRRRGDATRRCRSRCSDRPADVAASSTSYEIDRVLIASSVGSHEETLDLVRTVRRPDVQVSIVPRYFEIFTSHAMLDDVEGMPVVTLPPMRLGRSARLLKRTVDIVVVGDRAARARAAARGDRGRDQARQHGAGALPPAAPRPPRLDVPHRQVPDDVRRGRGAPRRGPAHERGRRAALQDQGRGPARHAGRRVPAHARASTSCRSSGTSSGRDEPRRPAAVRRLRGRPDHGLGVAAPRHDAGDHRASGRCSGATTSPSRR